MCCCSWATATMSTSRKIWRRTCGHSELRTGSFQQLPFHPMRYQSVLIECHRKLNSIYSQVVPKPIKTPVRACLPQSVFRFVTTGLVAGQSCDSLGNYFQNGIRHTTASAGATSPLGFSSVLSMVCMQGHGTAALLDSAANVLLASESRLEVCANHISHQCIPTYTILMGR
jgi:hypothetical protein